MLRFGTILALNNLHALRPQPPNQNKSWTVCIVEHSPDPCAVVIQKHAHITRGTDTNTEHTSKIEAQCAYNTSTLWSYPIGQQVACISKYQFIYDSLNSRNDSWGSQTVKRVAVEAPTPAIPLHCGLVDSGRHYTASYRQLEHLNYLIS